ncbi:MAG: hypothetical protein NC180_01550 [Muribaculaceae bacterium]|nr:hypothetical protein [Roseburia sp.]MCM1430633.1 hypothetical protein [Muribaculaceae bacterium]MCM1491900.1 hypothetical protein [Muribaculaceae bacterium]
MEVRDIFKVTSVGSAASSIDLKSRLKEEMKNSTRQFGMHSGSRAGRADWTKNLEGATLGYTRNAQAYFTQEMQKEYTY